MEDSSCQPGSSRMNFGLIDSFLKIIHGFFKPHDFYEIGRILANGLQQRLAIFMDLDSEVARITMARSYAGGFLENPGKKGIGAFSVNKKGWNADGCPEKY